MFEISVFEGCSLCVLRGSAVRFRIFLTPRLHRRVAEFAEDDMFENQCF
jgi:hypothetical protein